MIYLIGSLRNPEIPKIGNKLRAAGFEVFDDWYAAGPEADDKWKEYEQQRGRNYAEALEGAAAKNVYAFDRRNLEAASSVVLVLPAGKSGHLELGWALGRGKRGYILLDSPDRWDVMYQFTDHVTDDLDVLIGLLNADNAKSIQQTPQQLSFDFGVCGATDGLGQPFRIESQVKGKGSGGYTNQVQTVVIDPTYFDRTYTD